MIHLKKNGDVIKPFEIKSSPVISDEEIKNLAEGFFYTVVTNYSLQSFVSSNYICDTLVYNRDLNIDDDSKNVDNFGLTTELPVNARKSAIWIDRIFHKNDGYVRSIVLNPYRSNGIINMEVEKLLAQDRLIAFLIDGKKNLARPNYCVTLISASTNFANNCNKRGSFGTQKSCRNSRTLSKAR